VSKGDNPDDIRSKVPMEFILNLFIMLILKKTHHSVLKLQAQKFVSQFAVADHRSYNHVQNESIKQWKRFNGNNSMVGRRIS
jgi:hypothetical protein